MKIMESSFQIAPIFLNSVVVVVVVGAAYCTDIFPQRTHINTLLCSETCNSINGYYATNSHGTMFFLELCLAWEILFSSGLRRRSDNHDFAVCLGVRRQSFTSEDGRTCRDK